MRNYLILFLIFSLFCSCNNNSERKSIFENNIECNQVETDYKYESDKGGFSILLPDYWISTIPEELELPKYSISFSDTTAGFTTNDKFIGLKLIQFFRYEGVYNILEQEHKHSLSNLIKDLPHINIQNKGKTDFLGEDSFFIEFTEQNQSCEKNMTVMFLMKVPQSEKEYIVLQAFYCGMDKPTTEICKMQKILKSFEIKTD